MGKQYKKYFKKLNICAQTAVPIKSRHFLPLVKNHWFHVKQKQILYILLMNSKIWSLPNIKKIL